MRLSLFFLILLIASVPVTAQQYPQRIVSMNLCTDQLLLLLVEKNRIAALSYLATNSEYSALAAEASGIPTNRGQADEIITFMPDLVLTSQFSATQTANLLERMHYKVHRLGFAESLQGVYKQINEIAQLTGTDLQAEVLIHKMQTNINLQTQKLNEIVKGKSAAFFSSNGFTYGSGTLQDDFINMLGMHNVAADAGFNGPALLPLEILLSAAPDFIFMDKRNDLDKQLAHPLLNHPALVALAPHTRVLTLADSYFQCAGPELAEAYQSLAEQLDHAQ